MRPAGWKLFGHAMFELSQLNVTEVAKFVQRNFQNLFTKAAPPGKQILLIFPWVRVRNLASKALSLAAQRIRKDWEERYGYGPVLLETFVEVARYRGTCYQAANWIRLGETRGRGRMDRHTRYLSTPRAIYVYPLVPEFRAFLQGASGEGQGQR